MRNFKNVIAIALFLIGASLFAQSKLTGVVVDENSTPLPGANVVIKGTTKGTTTDFDGKFALECQHTSGVVEVSFVGYETKSLNFNGTQNFGTLQLDPSNELDEIVIVGVADIAKDRQTPVAVSTIKATEIVEKLGTKEFPEILNSTPSVYATKQGGGFGDSRVNVRGFDQANTAVLINGVPVNDMENGWVYWSNWAGLSDVTSAMQVQRGLGSSKLAISSVGGTINVLTNSSEAKEGAKISATIGNDNYLKTMVSYNTGKLSNGFSTSVLLGRTSGDGYVDGTSFEGYNYYLAFGYKLDNQSIQFTVTGAPQVHNQRGYANPINQYFKYGENDEPNIKYNSDWGWMNGKEATFSGNFYHKPIASLNWDLSLGTKSKISSVLYASLGRGGSVGSIGKINNKKASELPKDANGLIQFDQIVAWNQGQANEFGIRQTYTGGTDPNYVNQYTPYVGQYVNGGEYKSLFLTSAYTDNSHITGAQNGITQRSSMNSHNWFGLLANFNHELNENFNFDFGVDLRTYKGIHYRRIADLLGAKVYVNNDNVNNLYNFTTETYSPDFSNIINVFKSVDDEEKIDYYNDGNVRWEGAFGQLEYKNESISAFVQGGASYQQFQRVDYFNYLDNSDKQTTEWINIFGGNVKGGVNFNINDKHNVFANAGYYSKQPGFDAIFLNYVNDINPDYRNEKVLGTEIGYGFRTSNASVNLNLYRTNWEDRFMRVSQKLDVNNTPTNYNDDVQGYADILNISQLHLGAELDITYKPVENLRLQAMVSVGDWQYNGSVQGTFYDSNNVLVNDINGKPFIKKLYLDGVKVGDAAQFTSRLGFDYEPFNNFNIGWSQFFADKLYANLNLLDFSVENHKGALQLPSYSLADLSLSYKFEFNDKMGLTLGFNVNNLFDQTYMSEADTNKHIKNRGDFATGTSGDTAYASYMNTLKTYQGLDQSNQVYFGWGRTWSTSVRFNF